MAVTLIKGTCAALLDNVSLPGKHVQVLGVEKVAVQEELQYRIIISDGVHCIPVMLSTQLNDLAVTLQTGKYAVLAIEQYLWVEVLSLRIVIVEDAVVTAKPLKRLGCPTMLSVSKDPKNTRRSVATYLSGAADEERKECEHLVKQDREGPADGSDVSSTDTSLLCMDGAPRVDGEEEAIEVVIEKGEDVVKEVMEAVPI
ncbi:hypothetical protein CALVIDRAFT_531032 [Calocera viscosa TUFC12733]|uniref:Replication factor-A protein 1 N-terminal domain-containing protein n=1 Tax=Calocera viscosa (strain TUFC12733) TaxID=1330018 RepID=A0A167H1L2_CALVF|nr:hypothetical protein CALVIDRAFT_531032 [Calocera viscosa TUFC12733]